jgi:hypothetical protein
LARGVVTVEFRSSNEVCRSADLFPEKYMSLQLYAGSNGVVPDADPPPDRSADAELDLSLAVTAGRPKLAEKVRSIVIRIRISVTVRIAGPCPNNCSTLSPGPTARPPRTVGVR